MKKNENGAKLFWENKPIFLDYENLTGKISRIFYELIPKLPQSSADKTKSLMTIVMSKYIQPGDDKNLEMRTLAAIQEAFRAGELTKEEIQLIIEPKVLSSEEMLNKMEIYYTLFHAMIKKTNLSKQHLELINSPFDSDFWQSQDFNYIINEVDTFRLRII